MSKGVSDIRKEYENKTGKNVTQPDLGLQNTTSSGQSIAYYACE